MSAHEGQTGDPGRVRRAGAAPLAGLAGPERLPAADVSALLADLGSARERTRALHEDLRGADWLGPRLPIVNPPLWEVGHVGWFQEWWCLRGGGAAPSLLPGADALYHSSRVAHRTRWDLPLPDPDATWAYLEAVSSRLVERLASRGATAAEAYFVRLAVAHEDMHDEAFLYTRQTHGWPAPSWLERAPAPPAPAEAPAGDVEIPGGTFLLGAAPGQEPFVFDNERWAHPVTLAPFALARRAVTDGELAAFVDEGGYRRPELWTREGWAWREQAGAGAPLHWRAEGGGWLRRTFDRWEPLEPGRAALHVGAHEAEAYCRWAGRRLPTEAEWEAAATGALGGTKRRFPWGEDPPAPGQACLGARTRSPVAAAACPAGDAPGGLRQAIGNVWEWCASAFGPYPGFEPDPYADYSAPWFGDHRVLRGGCFATEARLLRGTWRNFYRPDRRDVFAGLRTARIDAG